MWSWLAQVKLEEVFRSTQQSMDESPASERVLAMVLGSMALAVLLVVLQQRRKRAATPKVLNSPGKLMKEVIKTIPLKAAELKQLKRLAEEQSCSSPLVLLLCPSLLAKGVQHKGQDEKLALAGVVKKISGK